MDGCWVVVVVVVVVVAGNDDEGFSVGCFLDLFRVRPMVVVGVHVYHDERTARVRRARRPRRSVPRAPRGVHGKGPRRHPRLCSQGKPPVRRGARSSPRPDVAHPFSSQIRRQVAEWHSRFLFKNEPDDGQPNDAARSVLFDTSRTLESLEQVSGVHSLLLAVDPSDPSDPGFLGGTPLGREFWRGLRSGGDLGAKNFKLHCLKDTASTPDPDDPTPDLLEPPTTGDSAHAPASSASKRTTANAVKTEIYASVRNALRF